ncbi:unnamed protein product [Owenia fusiformis]|uniref:G-protein coupled receptors family 1 profile domain-containing protein n=1 Tax=Owenia fusiformis TaxID=6347 RepID=A0A8S4N1W8_OWEFU|nr:unnamed protein product [Owenia fusiformis]
MKMQTTMKSNCCLDIPPLNISEIGFQFTAIIILDVLCIVGNILLILTISKSHQLHTISNGLILNLGIADLLVAVLVVPFWAVTTLAQVATVPNELCVMVGFFTVTLFLESMTTLGGIAFDRYCSICRPLRYPIIVTNTRAIVFVVYSWAQSAILAAAPFFGFGEYRFKPSTLSICTMDFLHDTYYSVLLFCVAVLPSCLTIIICYSIIFKVVRDQVRKVKELDHSRCSADVGPGLSGPGVTSGVSNGSNRMDNFSETTGLDRNNPICIFAMTVGKIRLKPTKIEKGIRPDESSNKKSTYDAIDFRFINIDNDIGTMPRIPVGQSVLARAAVRFKSSIKQSRGLRTIGLIIGCFLICWTPYCILIIRSIITGTAPDYDVEFIITFLAFANCFANPIICLVVNREFKKAMKKILMPERPRMLHLREIMNLFNTITAVIAPQILEDATPDPASDTQN